MSRGSLGSDRSNLLPERVLSREYSFSVHVGAWRHLFLFIPSKCGNKKESLLRSVHDVKVRRRCFVSFVLGVLWGSCFPFVFLFCFVLFFVFCLLHVRGGILSLAPLRCCGVAANCYRLGQRGLNRVAAVALLADYGRE
uniref:Transmembrane protein n=1 Tax=Physcomitrium patens TaxID=3218 RepID=A0A2K1JDK7_PHYPA|nr:hypothetical protein PHYPA_019891 [Physcomitrium patens]